MAALAVLLGCPDEKIKDSDSTLERARERTNTNVDHDTTSPLERAGEKVQERTNNNVE
ncbi:MAG TPA: hypothetical protein VLC93_08225 [Myxococcota bacterium]|nr:hypothetical protein [Myxococcota bacterium]